MARGLFKTGNKKILLWKKTVGLSWAEIWLLVLVIIMAGAIVAFLAVAR
jgi:cell division protein FtsX